MTQKNTFLVSTNYGINRRDGKILGKSIAAKLFKQLSLVKFLIPTIAIALTLAIIAEPAAAHHAFGGKTPTNFFEGFSSGLAHPIIGIDHFAFVVAIGMLAALKQKGGIFIPVAFIIATMMGTGIHLLNIDLPVPEIIISASVLILGAMLAMKKSPNLVSARNCWDSWYFSRIRLWRVDRRRRNDSINILFSRFCRYSACYFFNCFRCY